MTIEAGIHEERWGLAFDRVVAAYASLGFPHEVIGQWALPAADVAALLREVEARRPRRILEIGTFVGVTTQLLAEFSPPGAEIHTVDPNLELAQEFASMGSRDHGADVSTRAMDLARCAAAALGHDGCITFHEGGFSTGATFHSTILAPEQTVGVCGPEVCERHGPFDLVFLDGLHFESAVFSDLELVAAHLTGEGCIVLHDAIGMWGSNVRRAVYRFLECHPEFDFSHEPYAEVYHAIGVLARKARARAGEDRSRALLGDAARVHNFGVLLVRSYAPRKVVLFGGDEVGLGAELRGLGVDSERVGLGPAPQTRADLAVCLDVLDQLEPEAVGPFLDHLVASSDTIVVGTTPPGQGGRRPISAWAREFLQRGYLLEDSLRPQLEPQYYPNLQEPVFELDHPWLLNLLVARRVEGTELTHGSVGLAKDARIEDLSLQLLYLGTLVRRGLTTAAAASAASEQRAEQLARLDQAVAQGRDALEAAHAEMRKERAELARRRAQLEQRTADLEYELERERAANKAYKTALGQSDVRFGQHMCLRYPRVSRWIGRVLRVDVGGDAS